VFISVDIEASGPSPSTGSLVAIGACRMDDPSVSFYCELRPIPDLPWDPGAEAVHQLSRTDLEAHGLPPAEAMARFAGWIEATTHGSRAVMVGFNAPFDWMFVADYFNRFLGRNPLGISALDLKSLFMGRFGIASWAETTKDHVARYVPVSLPHTHNALDDARMQAELGRALLDRETRLDEPEASRAGSSDGVQDR
jgi:DNA polymerase III epsilon subunit-like protein